MAEQKGPLTTLNNALPSGLDTGRILLWQLLQGRSYDELRADLAAALNDFNTKMLDAWGDLMFITEDDHFEYPDGGAVTDFPVIGELDKVDLYKGGTKGHMIDLLPRGKGIGGSWRFFRDNRESAIVASVRAIVQSGRQTFEKGLLNRAMTDNANLLGTAGYDLGFCNASAGVTYTPPIWGGKAFTSSHTHYVGVDSGSYGYDGMLDQLMAHLQEHGHAGPFVAKISESNIASYRALTGFVQPVGNTIVVVDRGGETSGNRYFETGQVGAPGMAGGGYYIGRYSGSSGECLLYATARIPSGYAFVYKSYGRNNAKNPIAVRVHPEQGFGFFIREEASDNDKWPVKMIRIEFEYGISVGADRMVGAAGYLVAGGVWVDPTIS